MIHIKKLITVALAMVCIFSLTTANTKSKVKTQQIGNGVEVTMALKGAARSYAIYEEIYQNGRLVSGMPQMSSRYGDLLWNDMPYKHSFELRVKTEHLSDGGFSGNLTSVYAVNDVGMELNTELPRSTYTGAAYIVGGGNVERTLSKETHSIDAGDNVILMSVVLSTEPNGEICVYNRDRSLTECNDTVIQYRLVTSTEVMSFGPKTETTPHKE